MESTIVHVVRHGQVHNPEGVLYGQLPGFRLSELGQQMANRLGDYFKDVPLTHLRCSPLQRAQETLAPIAANHQHLDITTDERVIEAANEFEGKVFGASNAVLFNPKHWWHFRNPMVPTWGEPYKSIAARMREAILEMARVAHGGQALVVSHQLPIWMARSSAEGRPLVHDPRRRECTLASVTSFVFHGSRLDHVDYAEPCADLLPKKTSNKFRVGT